MHTLHRLLPLAAVLLLNACAATGPVVRDLHHRGLTEAATAKLVFVSGQNEPAPRIRTIVVEPGVTRFTWNALQDAKPSEPRPLVSPRTLEIYDSIQARIPAATFLVEGDQITPADQPQTGAYHVEGLYELMGVYLQTERERSQRGK